MSEVVFVTPMSYEAQQVQSLTVQAQWLQAAMGVIMLVWMGAFVVSQMVKVIKGEEIEKPQLLLGE